jgi:hypothetical protein
VLLTSHRIAERVSLPTGRANGLNQSETKNTLERRIRKRRRLSDRAPILFCASFGTEKVDPVPEPTSGPVLDKLCPSCDQVNVFSAPQRDASIGKAQQS